MKPGFWPDLPKMQQTMKDAGYKPIEDRVELTVTGKVVKQGDGLAIEVDGLKTPVSLRITAAQDDPDAAAHLERHVGETVELEGGWQPAPVEQKVAGMLAVTAIYGADDRKPGGGKK